MWSSMASIWRPAALASRISRSISADTTPPHLLIFSVSAPHASPMEVTASAAEIPPHCMTEMMSCALEAHDSKSSRERTSAVANSRRKFKAIATSPFPTSSASCFRRARVWEV
ncbi:MAG: hypothetical protein BWY99_02667 [Synergistetes bacterium ADurb.BinA166]|nr:MAG: hypothetical protein BWY99_02667 [Synergistetes bacterium ADurb.BinA166]